MNSNFQVMFGGFSLIFFYVAATLGRWNALEQRVSSFVEALYLPFWQEHFLLSTIVNYIMKSLMS